MLILRMYSNMSEKPEKSQDNLEYMKRLERSFRKGKITQEFYDSESERIKEEFGHAWFSETQEHIKRMSGKENSTLDMKSGHIVIKLICPRCGREGENTYGNIEFRILGKDKSGSLYFECPQCKEHLQYDPMSGQIKTRKGLLGFLFGRFS